jgi:DNA-binding NtrC family response regulator
MDNARILVMNDESAPADEPQIPAALFRDKTFKAAKTEAVRSFEHQYACTRLMQSRGNVTAAARKAGLHRSAFQRLIRKYGIRPVTIKEMLTEDPGLKKKAI